MSELLPDISITLLVELVHASLSGTSRSKVSGMHRNFSGHSYLLSFFIQDHFICRAELFAGLHTNVCVSSRGILSNRPIDPPVKHVKMVLILHARAAWTVISPHRMPFTTSFRTDSVWNKVCFVKSTSGCPSSSSFMS